MRNRNSFSLRARGHSIRYAFEGILSFFRQQHNAIIHLFFTIVVFVLAVLLKINTMEMVALILAMGFVWSAEIFNTVIEAIMDHLSPGRHHRVKFIKDVAAAAVLVAALTSMAVGCYIFIPKLL